MSTEATQEQQTEVPTEVSQEQQVEQVQVEQADTEQTQESAPNDDALLEAGFNAAQGKEEPKPEPEPEPEPEAKLFAGFTEEQIKDMAAKAAQVDRLLEQQNKLFGTVGNLKQQIEKAREQASAPRATPVSKDALKRLSSDFPELADAIAEDLSSLSLGGAASPDVSESIKAQIEQIKRDSETKLLTLAHRDWRDVVKSQEFSAWTQTLDESARAELAESWDSEVIGGRISEFKAFREKQKTTQEVKTKRLEQAIQPKSGGSVKAPQSEDDAFVSGFRNARGIR